MMLRPCVLALLLLVPLCSIYRVHAEETEAAPTEGAEANATEVEEISPEELAKREKEACKEGHMNFKYPSGGSYTGACTDGKRNGKGRYEYPDGSIYDGAWSMDEKDGYASYYIGP